MYKSSVKRNQEQAVRQAGSMRDRAAAQAMKRKEEYLVARVPRELKDRVLVRAQELGIPASILIRQVLEEAFGAVADEIFSVSGKRDDRKQEPSSSSAGRFRGVLGWEEIGLNQSVKCSGCGIGLESGMRVTLGIRMAGEQHIVLCDLCKRVI